MDSKNSDHEKPSTSFDLHTVIQMNYEEMLRKKCSTTVGSSLDMDILNMLDSDCLDEDSTDCGLDQNNSKQMKLEQSQDELRNYIVPFDLEYLASYFSYNLNELGHLKFKKSCRTPLTFSKLHSDIVLDFIKLPSLDKVKNLLDLLYTESVNHINTLNKENLSSHEQNRQISKELKIFLFELCYKEFCEYWLINPLRVRLFASKQFKKFIRILLRHTRCKLKIKNRSLKKLILHNLGLSVYPKKSLLVMCINLIYKFFITLEKKCTRSHYASSMKLLNWGSYNKINNYTNETQFLKLYHTGTTKKKTFLEIIEEYKHITKTDRLSCSQINDIKYAYSNILEPGESINIVELEKCNNENYNFNSNDGTKTNHITISDDLNTINNDDFDFDDIDKTPESLLNILYKIPNNDDISSISNIDNYKTDKFPKRLLEWVEELQSRNNFIFEDFKKNAETTKNNSKDISLKVIEEEVHVQSTSNEDHNIQNETLRHYLNEAKMFIDSLEQRTAIINQDKDISTDDLEGTTTTKYSEAETSSENLEQETALNTLEKKINSSNNYSKISDRYKNKLLSHSINLTNLEKSILTIIIFSKKSLYQINWDKFSPSTKTRIFQIIVQLGSLKMALCDNLKLDCLGLKEKKLYSIKNVEKILKSIQANPFVLQKYFPFSEVEHFLTWPLSKIIVDNSISQKNPTINILFSFFKNIISKFCENVKDFSCESDLRIVLNKESLFESLSCVKIEKYIRNTKLSLKYANSQTQLSLVNTFLNDALKKFNSENFCLTNTRFCIKKNSLNKEICKSMIDIFKNIVLYIDSSSESTGINVEAAINNALIILHHHPCFAKAYESYPNSKYPKCLTNSKYDNTSGSKNPSDCEATIIRVIEKLQIEPNVNAQTDPIDANNVNMSLITNNIHTSMFDGLNSDQINNSITSDPQCTNYNFNNDFINDFTNLINEQGEVTSDNLFEHIGAIGANNMFNTFDNDMIQIDDTYINPPLLFNEDSPFDDISLNNSYDDMQHETNLVNDMLGVNLQFQQTKNTEEVSLISSCDQLVKYAVSDEISLDELNMAVVDEQYGFDNAGVLLPP